MSLMSDILDIRFFGRC